MESKLKPYILLAPVAIILISIMGFGIANCVMQSLGYMPYICLLYTSDAADD